VVRFFVIFIFWIAVMSLAAWFFRRLGDSSCRSSADDPVQALKIRYATANWAKAVWRYDGGCQIIFE
jgi:hypothetical protein